MNTEFYRWREASPEKILKGFTVSAKDTEDLIKSLTDKLKDIVPGSTGLIGEGKSVRELDFKLGKIRGTKDPKNPEAKAERCIAEQYEGIALCGTEKSAFLKSIHSYQVPMAAKGGDGLGKIDLLGSTVDDLPAVVELKCSGKTKNRCVGGLLGPILQGLAYTLTIRHYCLHSNRFQEDWKTLPPGNALPTVIDGCKTPIIVAADVRFWGFPTTWEECPWSRFELLSEALDKVNMPLFAARFESSDNPMLEFVPFARLKGHESGAKPIAWP